MKIRIYFCLLLILYVLSFSCTSTDFQRENNALLTSTRWAAEEAIGNGPKFSEVFSFQKDGRYTSEVGELKIEGAWKWTGKNEIYLQLTSLIVEGKHEKLHKSLNSYIRILKVSENKLRILERFETDSWDSGFAKEGTYTRI